ncbi:MAG: lactate utilization protein [Spirochaetia bacterium]
MATMPMDFSHTASPEAVDRAMKSVSSRGISVELVSTRQEALDRLKGLIPAGASLSTGASVTLREIGFEDLLISKAHPWRNLKDEILDEKDPARQALLRRQSTLADYFVGSVHAIAQTGELVIASATGSQISPYAYASRNVIWVAGTQKITPTLDDGIRRVREYIFPHEEKRMRELTAGKMGTLMGKILIFENETPMLGRKIVLILVKETVGD